MDITQLVETLYNNKPMPACTQRISIQEGNSVNQQFKIISLIVLEGLEKKIVMNPTFDTCGDEKKFLKQMSILLKLYLASVGVKIDIEILTKKDISKTKLVYSPNFWANKTYKFGLACLYRYVKKGYEHALYYNPKSKLNHFSDGFLVAQIRNHVLKITLKEY